MPIDKEIPATWMQFRDEMPGIAASGNSWTYWGEWRCPDGQKPILHEDHQRNLTIELAKPTCKAAD